MLIAKGRQTDCELNPVTHSFVLTDTEFFAQTLFRGTAESYFGKRREPEKNRYAELSR